MSRNKYHSRGRTIIVKVEEGTERHFFSLVLLINHFRTDNVINVQLSGKTRPETPYCKRTGNDFLQ